MTKAVGSQTPSPATLTGGVSPFQPSCPSSDSRSCSPARGGREGTSQLPYFTVIQAIGNVPAFAAGCGLPPHFWPVNAVQLPHDRLLQSSSCDNSTRAELGKPGDMQLMVVEMSSVHTSRFVLYMIYLPLLPDCFFSGREALSGLRSDCRVICPLCRGDKES